MLIVLSPAKTLDYETPTPVQDYTRCDFLPRSAELIEQLRQLSPQEVGSLMSISDPLAQLNADRFARWSPRFSKTNSRQAIFAFNGDVYEGLQARSLSPRAIDWAQQHIRILSGLYGLLRPLDRMQPYRLEMGTRLANGRGRDLYAFWGEDLSRNLAAILKSQKAKALVNLASEEYFKAVKPALLGVPVITPVFEDWKDGRYKIISFHAKRARGLMARYAALKGISDPAKLQAFDSEGYAFDPEASRERAWVFRRRLD
ncbi:MAG: yaaA [Paucimonas sp.]|nr:yaaA [Paucimonas sp.]